MSSRSNNIHSFPATASVELLSGSVVPMSSLSIGDIVRVAPGPNNYSPVFTFTHKVSYGVNSFIIFETASGESITLTAFHYIYSCDVLVTAISVTPGVSLTLSSGARSEVTKVYDPSSEGLYNPHTALGVIFVNGIVASRDTTSVEPSFAHAVLAPFRTLLASFTPYLLPFEASITKTRFNNLLL